MLVLIIENAPARLIGFCSSWAVQVGTHIFVASLPKRAREKIWDKVNQLATVETNAVLVWSSTRTEQGFEFLVLGAPRRRPVMTEGFVISMFLPTTEQNP